MTLIVEGDLQYLLGFNIEKQGDRNINLTHPQLLYHIVTDFHLSKIKGKEQGKSSHVVKSVEETFRI